MTKAIVGLPVPAPAVRLLDWEPVEQPELKASFERLNREWIEAWFAIEPRDEAIFADPAGGIVGRGGALFFLLEDEAPVGCCALVPEPARPDVYQLGKMAVTASARGRGYGDRLLMHALAWARARGAREVNLLTNTTLTAARALYLKHGFREVPFEARPGYLRSNVRMVLVLESPRASPASAPDPDAAAS
jgi:putative acetyltransferase